MSGYAIDYDTVSGTIGRSLNASARILLGLALNMVKLTRGADLEWVDGQSLKAPYWEQLSHFRDSVKEVTSLW